MHKINCWSIAFVNIGIPRGATSIGCTCVGYMYQRCWDAVMTQNLQRSFNFLARKSLIIDGEMGNRGNDSEDHFMPETKLNRSGSQVQARPWRTRVFFQRIRYQIVPLGGSWGATA